MYKSPTIPNRLQYISYSNQRRISNTKSVPEQFDWTVYGRTEIDQHVDTTVERGNCIIFKYTDRSCTVSPYDDQEYETLHNVPIVTAVTGYNLKNRRSYIMVFNEALSIPTLDHLLINPNQLQHHHTKVQYNVFCRELMHIESPVGDLVALLQREGT